LSFRKISLQKFMICWIWRLKINSRISIFRILRNNADYLCVKISFIINKKKKIKKIFFQKVIHEVPKSFFRMQTISGLSLERRANKFFQKSMLYGSLYLKFNTYHFLITILVNQVPHTYKWAKTAEFSPEIVETTSKLSRRICSHSGSRSGCHQRM